MIDINTKNMFIELWGKNPDPIIFAVIYIIGFNITLFIWWRKNINLPNWLYWTTLWVFDIKTFKKVFLLGPGLPIMIVWMTIGFIIICIT